MRPTSRARRSVFMHDYPYPIYLRAHRKRWALSQRELGALLGGVSPTIMSRYERLVRTPPLHVIVGAEFIFGEPARQLFPALYAAVEREVAFQATSLAETISGRDDLLARTQRELLEAIAARAASDNTHI